MVSPNDDLARLADVRGDRFVVRRYPAVDDEGVETGEMMVQFTMIGTPVDADAVPIQHYDLPSYSLHVKESVLQADYPDQYDALADLWVFLLGRLKTQAGL